MESETRLGRAWRTFLSCTNPEAEQERFRRQWGPDHSPGDSHATCERAVASLVLLFPEHCLPGCAGWRHLRPLKWGWGLRAAVCCCPFPSPPCCQLGARFVPGTLQACPSPHLSPHSPSSTLTPGCRGLPIPLPPLSSLQGVQEHGGAEGKDLFRYHRPPRRPCRKGEGAQGREGRPCLAQGLRPPHGPSSAACRHESTVLVSSSFLWQS